MAVKRVPLAATISTRDSTMRKDALIWNGFSEKEADGSSFVVRRFGYALNQRIVSGGGTARGFSALGSTPLTIIGSTLYSGNAAKGTVDATSKYQFTPAVLGGASVFLKDNAAGYTWDGTTLSRVPDTTMGNGIYTTTATGFGSGYTTATVTITDSTGSGAILTPVITSGTIQSYTVVNPGKNYTSPTLTVTGDGTGATVTATLQPSGYPTVTVPGVVYLDGYIFVLDATGKMWNCNLNAPLIWNPLGYITASSAPDIGVRIARYANYVVSFCQNSLLFLYDAGNASPASPLAPILSAVSNVGCACADSVVETENTVYWIGRTKQRGRSVYVFNGLVPTQISNQYIDRILNNDPLTNVYSYFLKIDGHALYVLTLISSNITLVYDSVSQKWSRWSTSALGSVVLVPTAVTVAGNTVTFTIPNHGLENPSIVNIGGSITARYTGAYLVTIIDANTVSYTVTSSIVGGINSDTINSFTINTDTIVQPGVDVPDATSFTVTPYVNNYFAPVFYSEVASQDLLLDLTSASLYNITEDITDDNGSFIYNSMTTETMDFGSNHRKFCGKLEIIGDKISDTAYVGYSDNDFQSFGNFRPVALAPYRSQLYKLSQFRRRAFQVVYIGAFNMRFSALELEIDDGEQ